MEVPPAKKHKTEAPPKIVNTGKITQFHCDYCQKDITRTVRIICAVCREFDLCVECFSVGVEISGHVKTHTYHVSDCLVFPIVTQDWTAAEELLLLEGIEMFGLGNWKSIAEHVGSKSDKKCEAHYLNEYLESSTTPLPIVLDEKQEKPLLAQEVTQEPEKAPASQDLIQASEPTPPANLPGKDLAGYMPLRGDFDVEHDNDAELILADMEFSEDDHPTERELKLRVIDIYYGKLDERERRKEFVIERGLLDYKKHQQMERRRPKDERELVAQMRPFARFHSAAEHNEFVGGLITALRLRKRIAQLKTYRENGIRTLAEAEAYEAEKKKRETELALKKQRERASYLYESGRQQSTGRERASRWLNRDRNTNEEDDKGQDKSKSRKRTSVTPLDISTAPGCELLTPKEKELCSTLRLLPKHYMVIKDTLIRESFRTGFLKKSMAKQMIKIDVNKTGKIYDFFVTSGWVSNDVTAPKNNPATKSTSTPKAPPLKPDAEPAKTTPAQSPEEKSTDNSSEKAAESSMTSESAPTLDEVSACTTVASLEDESTPTTDPESLEKAVEGNKIDSPPKEITPATATNTSMLLEGVSIATDVSTADSMTGVAEDLRQDKPQLPEAPSTDQSVKLDEAQAM